MLWIRVGIGALGAANSAAWFFACASLYTTIPQRAAINFLIIHRKPLPIGCSIVTNHSKQPGKSPQKSCESFPWNKGTVQKKTKKREGGKGHGIGNLQFSSLIRLLCIYPSQQNMIVCRHNNLIVFLTQAMHPPPPTKHIIKHFYLYALTVTHPQYWEAAKYSSLYKLWCTYVPTWIVRFRG